MNHQFVMAALLSLALLSSVVVSFGTTFSGRHHFGVQLSASVAANDMLSVENKALLSERGQQALQRLIDFDQENGAQKHVYANWPAPGVEDDGKKRLAEQLADLDASYPGGLPVYLSKAQTLLQESADGVNPFDEFEALVPEGESLSYDSLDEAEQAGVKACGGAVFVLVAGGLGERLGYSGIKLSLETNLCTNECYLESYVRYIQALQTMAREQTGDKSLEIPLVIMTSGDTDPLTRELLVKNQNFGMSDSQMTIVVQDKVPALKDGSAGLALDEDDRWAVQTKPHGHGDVHHLLYREGLVDQWEKDGKTHVIFIQDTNALVVNSVLPTLGVSVQKGYHMNSICIPRLAGEAAGAITRLEHKTDPSKSLVINVEYNQLDPLLRTQGKGDVPDPATGYSPFPGNANNLVLELGAYAQTLRGPDQGVVLEFVNPKYKDPAARTDFKKPTRLECMMQDIPKLFQKEMGNAVKIGFTQFDRWFTFSPAKNSLEAGQEAVQRGSTAPGTMSSAESDYYVQFQRKLGITSEDTTTLSGIPVSAGPRIVLSPSFAVTRQDIAKKVKNLRVTSSDCSMVLDGAGIVVEDLELQAGAALVIRAPNADTQVRVDGLVVTQKKGWEMEELKEGVDYPEHVRIRGYTMNKHETTEYVITDPGRFVIDSSGEVRKEE